ncbi:hypothetical protein E2C01_052865 [Portunus trituberculatus]|uniref:Uncharacterized protein n=1 Tax=Portunus trituberculatus TaxID=210409 RepID=A0A5B7GMZ8_PORTR|nr:hypothetical protein [Portunus trituberculatus]
MTQASSADRNKRGYTTPPISTLHYTSGFPTSFSFSASPLLHPNDASLPLLAFTLLPRLCLPTQA